MSGDAMHHAPCILNITISFFLCEIRFTRYEIQISR